MACDDPGPTAVVTLPCDAARALRASTGMSPLIPCPPSSKLKLSRKRESRAFRLHVQVRQHDAELQPDPFHVADLPVSANTKRVPRWMPTSKSKSDAPPPFFLAPTKERPPPCAARCSSQRTGGLLTLLLKIVSASPASWYVCSFWRLASG